MKFLIIGTGFIFPAHVEAIRSISGKIREVVNTTGNWRKVIKNSDADCVVILTPNDLHFPMAMEAVKRGKKVLTEKPAAITVKEAELLASKKGVYSVLQLRHHPLVQELMAQALQRSEIKMDISVYRDETYYQGWKGQKHRSGGVMFNLGIHYFDLLQYVFGEPKEVSLSLSTDKTAQGVIKGERFNCTFKVSTDAKREEQRRVFEVNGKAYNFSSQDNLSYENLHRFVYQDLVKGEATTIADCLPGIRLIESIYAKEDGHVAPQRQSRGFLDRLLPESI